MDADLAAETARTIAETTLGKPPGPLERVDSRSHHVFVGDELVVKIIEAGDHARLDREIALAVGLPPGLSAAVLSSGLHPTAAGDVRYACVTRLPGTSPGMGLAGVDEPTARRWARQAVARLRRLHQWVPDGPAAAVLHEQLDHGGFVGRQPLLDEIERLRSSDGVPDPLLDGLGRIAERSPEDAVTNVPVHADCHWGNWLVHDEDVTSLLDFEWARFGEPSDDWMFLARFSGPHLHAVLAEIADVTGTPLSRLQADGEVREVAHLVADLRLALAGEIDKAPTRLVELLDNIVTGRLWWP